MCMDAALRRLHLGSGLSCLPEFHEGQQREGDRRRAESADIIGCSSFSLATPPATLVADIAQAYFIIAYFVVSQTASMPPSYENFTDSFYPCARQCQVGQTAPVEGFHRPLLKPLAQKLPGLFRQSCQPSECRGRIPRRLGRFLNYSLTSFLGSSSMNSTPAVKCNVSEVSFSIHWQISSSEIAAEGRLTTYARTS